MISIVALWNQVQTSAKTGTSGYQSENDWNRDIDTVQKRIANVLCDNYDKSQKVEDALFGLLVTHSGTSTSTGIFSSSNSFGVISNPSDYFRLISLWINIGGIPTPASKIASSQISAYSTSYVRRPSVADGNYSYYYLDGSIQVMPAQQLPVTLVYCKVPPIATIVLTENSDANSDYVVATAGHDLIWSPVVYNLFYYHMMEMLGLEMKDQLLFEYSQLGIPKEYLLGMSERGEK
jgi:hypothetical protein